MVQRLLEWGADPCAPDGRGQTPLMLAIAAGKTEVALLLLDTE
jgi:ankyrin repeat protein